MPKLYKIASTIDRISDFIGKIAMYLIMILLAVVVFEVISRRFFNAPTVWTYELSSMLFGAIIMFIMPYGMLHKVNVSVELVTQKFSKKTQQIVNLTTYFIFFFPFMLVLLYAGWKFALSSWQVQETSWSTWKPPLYHYKTCIPVASFFTILQGVSEFLKAIIILKGHQPPPLPGVKVVKAKEVTYG
ncbi:MAG: TRAP transporter small permease subunit [Deltaproteobacteria bacterium]|jgi:TRAP-type mannitol/chloroaromatic compound transport system permease small subunit|nr:TRAP transporter small permease subunit [Deltaproteobacteria bacterium]